MILYKYFLKENSITTVGAAINHQSNQAPIKQSAIYSLCGCHASKLVSKNLTTLKNCHLSHGQLLSAKLGNSLSWSILCCFAMDICTEWQTKANSNGYQLGNWDDLIAQIGRARVCSFGNASTMIQALWHQYHCEFERISIIETDYAHCVFQDISSDLHDQQRNIVHWHL